jgi:uncharacterized membrane protein
MDPMTVKQFFTALVLFSVVYWAAVGVYLLLASATTTLVLPLAAEGIRSAFLYGALVGFCLYGVYDLTNHATLRRWPIA